MRLRKQTRVRRQIACDRLEDRKLLAFGGLPITIGAEKFDAGARIAPTADGGYVTAGLFGGTVDFDPGAGVTNLTSQSDTDIYIAKYDSTGALVWAKRIGGTAKNDGINSEEKRVDIAAIPERAGGKFINGVGPAPRAAGEFVGDLAVSPDGSIVLAGDFTGKVDFDPGPATLQFKTFDTDFYDAFVMKLDDSGNLTWAKQFGNRFTDTANAIAIDGSGDIFVTGLFTRAVRFVPGDNTFNRTANGRADAYVLKLDSAGAVQWVNGFGSGATDAQVREVGNDVALDSAGNVYVAGSFGGKVDFDPSKTGVTKLEARDLTDGFLAKYDNDGNFSAVWGFGGKDYDALTQVVVDSNDDPIIAGYFEGKKFDVDPGPAQVFLAARPHKNPNDDPRFPDVFVAKLSGGALSWATTVAGKSVELINDMKLDSADNIIVGGSFYDDATFGTAGGAVDLTSTVGPGSRFKDQNDNDRFKSYDAFLWKLDNSGQTLFAEQFGAEQDDFAVGLGIASDDSILVTGRFRSTVDFDPGAGTAKKTALGLADAFITAFNPDGSAQV